MTRVLINLLFTVFILRIMSASRALSAVRARPTHSLIQSIELTADSRLHTAVIQVSAVEVELQAHAILVKQFSQPDFQAVSYNNSSSRLFLNHYRTIRTGQRRGSKTSGFRKQRRKTQRAQLRMTPLFSCCCSSSKLLLFSFVCAHHACSGGV